MAKPYPELNKSFFKNSYNILKVLTTKSEIMKYLETYKDDNRHAVAFGVLKQPRETSAPSWFIAFEQRVNERFDKIEARLDKIEKRLDIVEERLDKIEKRLDNIVKLNNLKE